MPSIQFYTLQQKITKHLFDKCFCKILQPNATLVDYQMYKISLKALSAVSLSKFCQTDLLDRGIPSYPCKMWLAEASCHGDSICFIVQYIACWLIHCVCSMECPAVWWLSVGCSGERLCPLWNGAVWWQCRLWREPRWVWGDHAGCIDHEWVNRGHVLCFYY